MSKQDNNVLHIYSDDGEKKDILAYSSRLGMFLKDYPPGEGWAIQTKEKMYEQADSQYVRVRFRAYLVNPEGKTLTSRSSFGDLSDYKSWQKIETNACSRLLAALGYGSEVFDADEITDLQAQGFTVEQQIRSSEPQKSVKSELTVVPAKEETQVTDTEPEANEAEQLSPDAIPDHDEPEPVEPVRIPRTLIVNINRIALTLGEIVPDFKTKQEATDYLQSLIAKMHSNDTKDTATAES